MSLFAKRFPAGRWSFLGPGSEKKWYSTYIDRPQGEWDRVAELMMIKFVRKRTPSFPSHESVVPRNAQKQRRWKLSIHFCADGIRLKLFFAQLFLLISSVSTEQSQICVKNTVLPCETRTGRPRCWQRQSDPLFEPAKLLDENTYTFDLKFLHKKIYCRSTKNEWKGSHNNRL